MMTNIFYEKETIFEKTSKLIKESINKTLMIKDKIILGLPGGRNISSILNQLKKETIDWKKVHVFMVDERLVPIDSPDSNYHLIKKCLSDIIPVDNLHPFIFDEGKLNYSLEKYQQEIENFGGVYDIVLLSSGEDGHIGSLFPNHPSIHDNSDFFILIENSPKPPKNRMGISKNFLLKSKIGLIFFIGDTKREAYVKFLDNNIGYENCPAKFISNLPESYVLTNIKI